ncbi:MAG: glycosyltransferase family 39 protein [Flavobacteriales bacterium]
MDESVGLSNASAHLYALLVTVLCTLAVYWLLEKSFGQMAAFFASALVAIQPIFVAQSAMLYPEMMMTLGLILALKGYIELQNWLFAIGLSIAIYSKETAIVFFVAFMAWDFLLLMSSRSGLKSFAKYLVPVLVMLSHPALLYLYHGWFLFPGHTGYITFNIQDIKWNARGVFAFLFEKQNRGWIVYPAIVLGVLSLRLRKIWFNLLLIGIGFSVYKVFVWKWVVPTWLYIVIMLIGIFSPLILWQWSNRGKTLNSIHHLIGISYLLLIGFVIFSSMNFYTPRYMLCAIALQAVPA